MGLLEKVQTQKDTPSPKVKTGGGLLTQAEKIVDQPEHVNTGQTEQVEDTHTETDLSEQHFTEPEIPESTIPEPDLPEHGLLMDESHVFFYNLSKSNALGLAGILKKDNTTFKLQYAYKIADNTLFDSTKDFWDGTLSDKTDWNRFEHNEFTPFYQFFPSDELEDDSVLYIKIFDAMQGTYIFFFISKKNNTNIDSFLHNSKITEFMHIIDSHYDFIENISTKPINTSYRNIRNSLQTFSLVHCIELHNTVLFENTLISETGLQVLRKVVVALCNAFLPNPGFCLETKTGFKLLLFSHEQFDVNLFETILKNYLSEYFLSSTISSFSIPHMFNTGNSTQAMSFITKID